MEKSNSLCILSWHALAMKNVGTIHMTGGASPFYTIIGYKDIGEWIF